MNQLYPYEDPLRRCLVVNEWPVLDQSIWKSLFEAGDILDGTTGAGYHWSDDTREKYRKGYGRWLTYLHTSGEFTDTELPFERITVERIRGYTAELETQIADWTKWGRIAELLAVAKAFNSDQDWSWLRRLVRFLETNSHDSKNKLPRLRPAGEIAAWGYKRMDDIILDPPNRDPASRYRDALMITLLIICPTMRLKNLAMIEIGKHLIHLEEGYRLAFARLETKTRTPMSIPVPVSLWPYIDHYIETIRPQLLPSNNTDRLWITKYHLPMKGKAIYSRITKTTEKAFGISINPHLFRDCAVTTVAIEDPAHIGIAAPILGHTDPRTTEEHYIQANALVAGRKLRASIETLKDQLRLPARTNYKDEKET
jgi:integrase/recombinase XerD